MLGWIDDEGGSAGVCCWRRCSRCLSSRGQMGNPWGASLVLEAQDPVVVVAAQSSGAAAAGGRSLPSREGVSWERKRGVFRVCILQVIPW